MMWLSRMRSSDGGRDALHMATSMIEPAAAANRIAMPNASAIPIASSPIMNSQLTMPAPGMPRQMAERKPTDPERNPLVGFPPLTQPCAVVVWWLSPISLSENGHRKVQAMVSRVTAQRYRRAVARVRVEVLAPAPRAVGVGAARDIAGRAGVSLGAIGYHFGSTDALLHDALAEAVRRWLEPLIGLISTAPERVERD